MTANDGPFERNGLAALSDFQSSLWKDLYSKLEADQSDFLSKQHLFRSSEYKWPLDALHNWSRVWEYPYVFSQLIKCSQSAQGGRLLKVADIGSGVTFFPFSVARLGFEVICADPDPVCNGDFGRACGVMNQNPGKVEFRPIQGPSLPFGDAECDLVYCISVLEHIEDFENTIHEMWRLLKDNGLLFLTIDLDLQGNSQIGVLPYQALVASMRKLFDPILPDTTVHPADILDNLHGPCPMYVINPRAKVWHLFKQDIIKSLLRRRSRPFLPMHLAVQGLALRKRLNRSNE